MKIFILSSRFPYPIEKGDKLRLYYQIRELSKRHEIVLFSLTDTSISQESMDHLGQFCTKIYVYQLSKINILFHVFKGLWKGEAAQIAYFYRKSFHQKVLSIIKSEEPDHIFCQLIRMAKYALDSDISSTLDYMDAFSLGMQRRASHSSFGKKFFFKREARLLKIFEADVIKRFKHCTIIAKKDKSHIEGSLRDMHTSSHFPSIHLISNGIDLEYFHTSYPSESPTYDLVFVGNMGYFPNIMAAQYLVHQILPLLQNKYPQLTLLLAGASPSATVKGLKKQRGVFVSGWLPDIRDAYKKGKVFVAPLFTGSGQQNKILEAMAMGVPVITTSIVNQAIGGEDKKTVFLAENPESFSEVIIRLLENPDLREEIAHKARLFVEATYSWEVSVKKLEHIWHES